jgi:uncharacterized lipoprotein YbaY
MRRARAFIIPTLIFTILLIAGCGSSYPSILRGTVIYSDGLVVPPDATLKIELVDVVRQNMPPSVIAEQLIENPGSPPVAFEVNLNPQEINPKHSYYLVASVSGANGDLLYDSTQPYPVLTQGNPSSGVEIIIYQIK